MMNKIGLQSVLPELWKNGGGTTRTLRSANAGTGFDWRISIADIHESGAFSVFPGIDRIAVVLQNGPLRLSEDPAPGQLTPAFLLAEQYVPIAFPGDLALVSDIPVGPVMCLNIMTRRSVVCAQVRIINASTMLEDAALQMVLATDPGWQVNGQTLDRYDSMSGFTEASLAIEAPPDLRSPLIAVSILKAHAN